MSTLNEMPMRAVGVTPMVIGVAILLYYAHNTKIDSDIWRLASAEILFTSSTVVWFTALFAYMRRYYYMIIIVESDRAMTLAIMPKLI